MTENDIDPFFEMLDEVYDLMGKTQQAKIISAGAKAMFFRAVAHHSLADVREALDHHASTGTFTPVPKDVNEFIESRRPVLWVSGDEAWAQVPKLESDAGLLNQVTAAALAKAQPLIDSGEMIGARRAFIDAYDRLVAAAKTSPDPKQRVPVTWVSGGNHPVRYQDPHGERVMLLERGQEAGLLPAPAKAPELPLLPSANGPRRLSDELKKLQMKPMPQGDSDE